MQLNTNVHDIKITVHLSSFSVQFSAIIHKSIPTQTCNKWKCVFCHF